jgi:hypothetical protein
MKTFLMLVMCNAGLAGCLVSPASAEPCAHPDPAALPATWKAFRAATLQGQPEEAARYYRFPLKLLSPMDGETPLKIDRPVFIRNYAELFQHSPADSEVGVLTAMKKTTGKEYVPQVKFDEAKCAYVGPTRIEDYNFVYDKKSGWLVESLFYGSDYDIAKSAGLDRL